MTDPTSLPNFPPPPSEHPLRGRVLDALIDIGSQPDIDADGDVAFVVNDQQLFIRCAEGDVPLLRLFGQWQLPEQLGDDLAAAFTTCNELNLTLNCVKTGIANKTLVVTSEHIIPDGVDVNLPVQVAIQVVLATVHHWHERLFGPATEGSAASDGAASDGVEPDSPEGTKP